MHVAVSDAAHEPPLDMRELSPYAQAPRLRDVLASGARVTLTWRDGQQAHFPLSWLRDHCACEECRHTQTRERLYVPLAEICTAPDARIENGHLALVWADGHESHFDGGWLHQRRPGEPSRDVIPMRRPWRESFHPERITHAEFITGATGERAWLEALLRDGLVLLEDGPLADEEVSRLATRIGPLRSTNFGARFDVRSKPNPNNAAYTAIGLTLHTDLPNWRQPPDIQLLYCLENGAQGGESLFADGFQVAEVLRRDAPEAFRILSETPVDFRFQDECQDIGVCAPILECDADGKVVEVRFNNWIRDTLRLPAHEVDAWYEAYRHFWHLLHDPRHQLEFALAPGQMIAFDNRRVLHGRRAFDPNTGRRHLQGTYLDRDMLESRLRVLSRHS
ncbi:gamma-butyrobetaine,2-oxoglutarate dioxygenase [Litchfieldella qijiaojingensis]|uniref:Gamma-butyrobetaine,2-oxoglutarate dioxygenase n=1 Tax=Litchfieldella qijiaojingensis TaxID=980347 RepID=A0ABQ2YM88_9GAMM|nr:TauD/TfdA family dioxygenase [Halomonas qijiaojingensis]GGX88167.1 gamma-butyrobetaine,2-oxoglutarate dioxygenase [Halomonas qijiaojingensis]